jgi:hypothetical protein
MAQFDALIIFPLLWSLLLVLIAYYQLSIELLIPSFSMLGKFREKKLGLSDNFEVFNSSLLFKPSNSMFV